MMSNKDIKMQKLDMWMQGSYVNSLQITLTNGEKSEVFKSPNGTHDNQTTISLN